MKPFGADDIPPRRRFLAIINPISGRRDVTALLDEVAGHLASQGAELNTQRTVAPGHAVELARAAPQDVDAVLVVGGDGTINEVLVGLDGRAVPIAVLPTGTENLLAKHLRMPRRPLDTAALLLHGEARPHDLGCVNGRPFHSVFGVGFDAECVQRLVACRKGHIGYLSYVSPIWQTFWRHRFPLLRVDLDQATVFEGRGLLIAGLIPRYAAGLRVLRFADPTDGLLDVVIFECATRRRLLRHAINVVLGRHLRGNPENQRVAAGVIAGQGRALSVTSDEEVPVEVDGDPGGSLPLRAEVLSRVAHFVHKPERNASG